MIKRINGKFSKGFTLIELMIVIEDLSINNSTTSVALSGSVTGIMTVIVTDDSNRCPRQSVFRTSMGGQRGIWSTN